MQLAEYIPPAWYPFLVAWATYLLDLYQRWYVQVNRTFNAAIQSFSDEVIGFTETSMLPYSLGQEGRGVRFYDTNVYCVYNMTKGTIKIVDTRHPHTYRRWNSSWLAVSVATDETELGDLSVWLEGIRVEHNLDIFYPLRWLLLCYAYATHTELKYIDMGFYQFSVITEEAEEKTINWLEECVDTQSEIEETLTEETSTQETSSHEGASESQTTGTLQSQAVATEDAVDA